MKENVVWIFIVLRLFYSANVVDYWLGVSKLEYFHLRQDLEIILCARIKRKD